MNYLKFLAACCAVAALVWWLHPAGNGEADCMRANAIKVLLCGAQ